MGYKFINIPMTYLGLMLPPQESGAFLGHFSLEVGWLDGGGVILVFDSGLAGH